MTTTEGGERRPRPIVVDMTRIAYEVQEGILRDGLVRLRKALDGDVSGMDLHETGYAYGEVRCFRMAHFADHNRHVTCSVRRMAALCDLLLNPTTIWETDQAAVDCAQSRRSAALDIVAVAGELWSQGDPIQRWAVDDGGIHDDPYVHTQFDSRTAVHVCYPAPPGILEHAFSRAPRIAHVVREKGNRKWNFRFGLCGTGETDLHSIEDPMDRLRIISEIPPGLMP